MDGRNHPAFAFARRIQELERHVQGMDGGREEWKVIVHQQNPAEIAALADKEIHCLHYTRL